MCEPIWYFKLIGLMCGLQDRLDISKVAVIGHSFGGASTVATLATDDRFK